MSLCCVYCDRGFRGDPAARFAQEQYPSSDMIYEQHHREPRRRHDPLDRWRGEVGPPPPPPPGGGRRLPRPRGHSDVERWRTRHGSGGGGGGGGYGDDYYAGRRRAAATFDARSGDYHPQRLMRGLDGLDGPGPRLTTYGGGWRSRYDDDYPPERTELWSGENRHRLDAAAPPRGSRHRLDPTLRNDSLSSDPSDCMSAPPAIPTAASSSSAAARHTPKHYATHKNGGGGGSGGGGSLRARRQSSVSSSDDGVQTTPEGTSCDEQEIESESIVSEMGAYHHHHHQFIKTTCQTHVLT